MADDLFETRNRAFRDLPYKKEGYVITLGPTRTVSVDIGKTTVQGEPSNFGGHMTVFTSSKFGPAGTADVRITFDRDPDKGRPIVKADFSSERDLSRFCIDNFEVNISSNGVTFSGDVNGVPYSRSFSDSEIDQFPDFMRATFPDNAVIGGFADGVAEAATGAIATVRSVENVVTTWIAGGLQDSSLVSRAEETALLVIENIEFVASQFDLQPFDPLVLDLDGDGIELTSVDGATAYFDLDIDGFAEATGWVSGDDGLLAWDANGNGYVDNGSELFGDQTGYDHGYDALAAHDTNGDGVIDTQDAIFSDLIVWQDLDADGQSDVNEMRSLSDVGIASISVAATAANYTVAGNDIAWESTFSWADGSAGASANAFLVNDPIRTNAVIDADFGYHPDSYTLPVVAGVGHLASTRISISVDDALRQQAHDLVAQASSGDIAGFRAAFTDFVYNWAGVEDVDPNSHTSHVDARNLALFETILDRPYEWTAGHHFGAMFDAEAKKVIDKMALNFLTQVAASEAALTTNNESDYISVYHANPTNGLVGAIDNISSAISYLTTQIDGGSIDNQAGVAILDMVSSTYETYDEFRDETIEVLQVARGIVSAPTRAAFYGLIGIDLQSGTDGDDHLTGSGAEDYFIGGLGDDVLHGALGGDTYLYATGDGSDVIQETASYNNNRTDTFVFTDLTADDVQFSRNGGGDLVMAVAGETITVIDHFVSSYEQIEAVTFADGTTLNGAGIAAKSVADQASDGDDVIIGSNGNDGAIIGGLGDDVLHGALGGDTYLYATGDGSDVIQETASYNNNRTDTFVFTDLTADDVQFSRNGGGDLVMAVAGETITVIDHFVSSYERMEKVEFADGTVLDLAGIQTKVDDDALLV